MRRALPILFSASLLLGCDGTSPTDDDSTVASDNDTADDDAPDDDASITDNDTADDDSGDDDSTPCSDRCILGASPFDGGLVRGCALGPDLCPTWTPGLDCGSLGALCVEDGPLASCVPMGGATCWDAVANQGESDIDCGGPCAPCPLDAACQLDDDCSTGLCDPASLTCASPPGETCSDGMTNQGESDADCGGPCAPCGPDATCAIDDDCSTGLCDPLTFTCESPTVETCWDGLSNQDESGIDCGGALCAACGLGELCFASTDCQSGNCDLWDTETCVPGSQATCADAAQNDDESDVDCGGATCEPCDLGAACASDLDCASLNCDVGTTDLCVDAAAPTCSDGLWNQDEEDIDCGGSTCTSCTPPSYLLDEDWEDGDFSRFAWQLGSSPAGTFPWEIETVAANCEQGLFCVRTAPTHPAGEVAWFELSLSVREDSDLSFRARVNTEPGEHVLSVWVDGSFVQEWSGVQPWQTLTLPVPATGPGGPDRVLRFEYSRSSFVDPMHPPYNQVWIDVIDLPGWNSTPETPTLQSPWIDSVITDPTPLLQWMTDDPDGDTIIHQVQVSDDPLFTNPFDSGEIGTASWVPSAPLADGLWFWRVRAKDGIDHRYSPWSETWTFSLDSAALPGSLWLQDQESQFAANTLVDTATDGDSVVPALIPYDSGWTPVSATGPGQIEQWTLTGLPYVVPGSSGIVSVRTTGDFDALSEYCTASIDTLTLGNHNPQSASLAATDFMLGDITPYVVDGTATLTCSSNPGIASGTVEMRLQYTTSIDGTVMGPPVDFAWAFPGRGHWEKARWSATGDVVGPQADGWFEIESITLR